MGGGGGDPTMGKEGELVTLLAEPTVYSMLPMSTVLRVLHGNVRKLSDPFTRDVLSPLNGT